MRALCAAKWRKPNSPSLPETGAFGNRLTSGGFIHLMSQLLFPLLLAGLLLLLCPGSASAQQVAVKTNALYWLTSTPNASVEVGIDSHFSVQMSMGYNAWKFAGKHSIKHTSFIPEVRYWLSRTMERHYVGVYGQYSKFNLRNAPLFVQNDLAYRGHLAGGGLSYGYQWALGKRFGIEASVGLGYLYMNYSQYQYTDCCAERISDHRRSYFGPTRLALNLIYLIR